MYSESIYMPNEEEEMIQIGSNPITDILSCSFSISHKKTLLCTLNGFCLVNNATKTLKRFEKEESPFKLDQNGVSIGSVLEERTEVALVPSSNSRRYKKTSVYIFGNHEIIQTT